jgi:hypothetical protein
MGDKYNVSFRCFFENEDGMHYSQHYQPDFPIADIPRWIDAYHFTHPACISISAKVWFTAPPSEYKNTDED